MKRATFLSFLILALLATGVALREGTTLVIALPLITYLALGLMQYPRIPKIQVVAQLSQSSVSEGAEVGVSIELTNRGDEIAYLAIEDATPVDLEILEGSNSALGSMSEGDQVRLSYRVRASRGLHSLDSVELNTCDPLALFCRTTRHHTGRLLLARPNISRLRHVELQPLRTGVHAGLYRAQRGGPGVEFHGVRPYVAGDSQRWINWRASARHRETLLVNEFEQERAIEIGLIVDARARSNTASGGRSSFSYSIQAAASLADLFLTQANRVGLMLYGSHLDWTVPGYGRVQRERIMRALARARVGHSRVFDRIKYLPTRLFAPLSQLIFISPVLQEDVAHLRILRARRYPILVVSPDRISAEAYLRKDEPDVDIAVRLARLEQGLITRKLAHAGIQRVVWDVNLPLEQAVEMQIGRPSRWLRAVGARNR